MNIKNYYVMCGLLLTAHLIFPEKSLAQTSLNESNPPSSEGQALQQQLEELQDDYNRRLTGIEKRLQETQKATRTKKANTFNPAITLILNGQYSSYSNDPDDYQLPGFALNDEAGIDDEGFSLGESEITLGANIDQLFYGQATFALADEDGETSIETEEVYFETLALPHGLKLKAGRFYSAIGYLNQKHVHTWDFSDAPLVYRGFFGDQLKQDGVQASWLLPTDIYFLIGGEAGNGAHYPSSGSHSGVGDWLTYAKTGGDIGLSHSWQLGLSHWQATDIKDRASQGLNSPEFSGTNRISGMNAVYKWAPEGNTYQQNLKLQAEIFHRDESGDIDLLDTAQSSYYDGEQTGWYAQAIYQFIPRWEAGYRYDRLSSDNKGSDTAVLDQAQLLDHGHTPQRNSVMLAWQPSEYSRLRVQYNRDESSTDTDNQFFIQYTMIMGAHGAHSY